MIFCRGVKNIGTSINHISPSPIAAVCCRWLTAFQYYFLFKLLKFVVHVFQHFQHSFQHCTLFIIVGRGLAAGVVQATRGHQAGGDGVHAAGGGVHAGGSGVHADGSGVHAGGSGVQAASGEQVAVGGV